MQKARAFGSPASLVATAAMMEPASELLAGRFGASGEACTAFSMELHADLGAPLDLVRGLPVALGVNMLRTPEGVSAAAAAAAAPSIAVAERKCLMSLQARAMQLLLLRSRMWPGVNSR